MKRRKAGKWKKGLLSAVFAAALVLQSGVATPAPAPPPSMPSVMTVFNQQANYVDAYFYGFHGNAWAGQLAREDKALSNPQEAAAFAQFLSRFDDLKGKSAEEQALQVTRRVNAMVKYETDGDNYGRGEYWASAVQTSQSLRGDCDDYAILKYAIMRYLGVPAERLFIATVSTDGNAFFLNHAVLLLRVAPANVDEGSQSYLILDNRNGEVMPTSESPYFFFAAWNEAGHWDLRGPAEARTGLGMPAVLPPPPAVQQDENELSRRRKSDFKLVS